MVKRESMKTIAWLAGIRSISREGRDSLGWSSGEAGGLLRACVMVDRDLRWPLVAEISAGLDGIRHRGQAWSMLLGCTHRQDHGPGLFEPRFDLRPATSVEASYWDDSSGEDVFLRHLQFVVSRNIEK